MANIKRIDSKRRFAKKLKQKRTFGKAANKIKSVTDTVGRKSYIMAQKASETESNTDEVDDTTYALSAAFADTKEQFFSNAWKRHLTNKTKPRQNDTMEQACHFDNPNVARDTNGTAYDSPDVAHGTNGNAYDHPDVTHDANTIARDIPNGSYDTKETGHSINETTNRIKTRSELTKQRISRTEQKAVNNIPKTKARKAAAIKGAAVKNAISKETDTKRKTKIIKNKKKTEAKALSQKNYSTNNTFVIKVAAICAVFVLLFVAIVFILYGGIVVVVNALDPLDKVTTISLAQACKIKEEGYQKEIIDYTGQRIQNLGDGFSYPIIVNQDIKWREVISLYLAYTSDKELEDPDSRFKIAGADYHYFETIFNECNLILTQYNREYYLNDNEFSLYYLDTTKEHNAGDLSDTAEINFTSATIVICSHPNAEAVAKKLEFNEKEYEELNKYLYDDKYDEYFNNLLMMISTGDAADIITYAVGEEGNDWHKYCEWFRGSDERLPWCAVFVSWAANMTGYYDAGLFPREASCRRYYEWYNNPKNPGTFIYTYEDVEYQKSLDIQPGWLIIWERDDDHSVLSHIGIVTSYDPEKKLIYTIEGNSGDKVATHTHCAEDAIWGFCCPAYPISSFTMYEYFSSQLQSAVSLGSKYEIFEFSNEKLEEVYKTYKVPGWAMPVVNEIISLTEEGIEIPDDVYADYVEYDETGCYDYWLEKQKLTEGIEG